MGRSVPSAVRETIIRQRGPFDAVLCDIDGCLAPEDGGPPRTDLLAEVARRNAEAIRTGEGPIVTVCTGRPIPFAEAICRAIANTQLPAIGEMGVWLYDPRTQLMTMDPAILPEHVEAINGLGRWIETEFADRPLFQQPGKSGSISLYHADTAYLMGVMPALRARCEAERWPMRISRTWEWINCDLAHVSKGTGIERFCEATGLTRDRLAGIGDTMGDLAIRDRVAWFGCPSNAAEDLKPHADAVSDRPEIEGVLDLLGRIASLTTPA